jgi:hypothetical protein
MAPGKGRVEVAAGRVEVRVECGLEYVRVKRDVEVSKPLSSLRIPLRRWADMRERGYLCGENHIHVATARLGPMLAAEGLDFGTSLSPSYAIRLRFYCVLASDET